LEDALRGEIREIIETVLQEELSASLGAETYERVASRCGHRNGSRPRTVTTSLGPTRIAVPRGLVVRPDGTTAEWQARVSPATNGGRPAWTRPSWAPTSPGIAGFERYGTLHSTIEAPQPDRSPPWSSDPGLLTGVAGIALALLAAATPIEPAWDRLLLIDLPPGAADGRA
jgi:hypothetical protein